VGAVCARAGFAGRGKARGGFLRQTLLPYELLHGRFALKFAARARSPGAKDRRAKSNFNSRSGGRCLDIAGKSGEPGFFRCRVAFDRVRCPALHAELFPASLIPPVERPWCALRRRAPVFFPLLHGILRP